jgi:general secretion pathway protein E
LLRRRNLYELLTVSQEFSKLIQPQADIHILKAQAIKEGLKPLRIAGAMKIREGFTTADEVLKVTAALN